VETSLPPPQQSLCLLYIFVLAGINAVKQNIDLDNVLNGEGSQEKEVNMPRRKKASAPPNPSDNPKTIQRTYRFDTKLFDAFEDDCATHLSNPKRVIEALILHWLDADSDERAAMAHKHRERIGSASREE
jgi:hypothetical protein